MGENRDQMNIVVIGHVDHGKSTVIGRLLADTGSLPVGKLEQVKQQCLKNSRPFEYAFLLDALKDEQSQGITIDSARCFFKTAKRSYIIIDAPGHIEFLKNMITGASRAEAALLVIDANEGIMENSRRHGFMSSILGIRQLIVLVNKMDLVGYREDVFNKIRDEYREFLDGIDVHSDGFIPVSARGGENIAITSGNMEWYRGMTVLERLDDFRKERPRENRPFRFPVQDIYKFTAFGDDRRIVSGTVTSGSADAGDEVVFYPSGKRSVINSIEGFNEPAAGPVSAGKATGFTMKTQIYIRPGEIMGRLSEDPPCTGSAFRANLFWVGKNPMITGKRYKIKIGTMHAAVYLNRIIRVIDAATLDTDNGRSGIERHDVAECILQTLKPVSFDRISDNEITGRFVIVDGYEIAGGGIIIEPAAEGGSYVSDYVRRRDLRWIRGAIDPAGRSGRYHQKSKFIVITGPDILRLQELAVMLEEELFSSGRNVYYLGLANIMNALDAGEDALKTDRDEQVLRLGEIAHIFIDAGMIFITTISNLDDSEYRILKVLNGPHEILMINDGNDFIDDSTGLSLGGVIDNGRALNKIKEYLHDKDIIPEYFI